MLIVAGAAPVPYLPISVPVLRKPTSSIMLVRKVKCFGWEQIRFPQESEKVEFCLIFYLGASPRL